MLSFYISIVNTDEEKEKVVYIYENYYSYMAYKAGQLLKNDQDIEDTVHNAMIKIIDNLHLIDTDDEVRAKGFCGIITKNIAIDFLRRKDNQNIQLDEAITENYIDDCDPGELLITKDMYDIILKAIESLKDTYRDVCLLKYVNGLKEREIALLLGLTTKNVSLRVFRGKQLLREALRKEKIHV